MLGQKIVAQLIQNKINFLATSNGENRNGDCPDAQFQSLDIRDKAEVEELLESYQPTHVIHTAAITNVDQCEMDKTLCAEVNTISPINIFHQCEKRNIHFQFLSTDFVFDGEKGNYSETDDVNPLSEYARSKVNVENELLKSSYSNWSIVRTIIVYGEGNNLSRSNLIAWAKSALPKGEEMKIVDDQFRAPTWADDLAWGCIQICNLDEKGIFHLSGPDTYSIFEIVTRIANYYNWSTERLLKIDSTTLNQPAKRPPKTGFNLSKSRKVLGYNPKKLEDTLDLMS